MNYNICQLSGATTFLCLATSIYTPDSLRNFGQVISQAGESVGQDHSEKQ